MEKEYFDSQGRTIKTEKIDGVTRQTLETKVNPSEYEATQPITSHRDVMSCLKDPRYKTDPHFRAAVFEMMKQADSQGVQMKLSDGSEMGVLEKAMAQENGNSDFILEQKESIQALFGDPRYKTSPIFRRHVAELVAQSDPRHETKLESFSYQAPARMAGQFAPAPKPADK